MVEIYEILFMRSMGAESPSIKVANSASSASNANKSQNSEGGLFYIGGQAGSVYSTVYREAIPETAKLTETGDSQVLVLQY